MENGSNTAVDFFAAAVNTLTLIDDRNGDIAILRELRWPGQVCSHLAGLFPPEPRECHPLVAE